jgi:hypothetical protein
MHSRKQKLYHTSALAARNYYHKLIFKYLETIAGDASVVELGAGYGIVILNYADMLNKAGIKRKFYAFEFTENGQECIRR